MLPVIWSPSAKAEYADLLQYLENEFGTGSALKMLDKAEAVIERVASFPEIFQASKTRPDIHKAVITPQTSLLYQVDKNQIVLLHFWDNRQDPERLSQVF